MTTTAVPAPFPILNSSSTIRIIGSNPHIIKMRKLLFWLQKDCFWEKKNKASFPIEIPAAYLLKEWIRSDICFVTVQIGATEALFDLHKCFQFTILQIFYSHHQGVRVLVVQFYVVPHTRF